MTNVVKRATEVRATGRRAWRERSLVLGAASLAGLALWLVRTEAGPALVATTPASIEQPAANTRQRVATTVAPSRAQPTASAPIETPIATSDTDRHPERQHLVVDYDYDTQGQPNIVWQRERDGWIVRVDAAGVIFSAKRLSPGEKPPATVEEQAKYLPQDLLREADDFVATSMPVAERDEPPQESTTGPPAR